MVGIVARAILAAIYLSYIFLRRFVELALTSNNLGYGKAFFCKAFLGEQKSAEFPALSAVRVKPIACAQKSLPLGTLSHGAHKPISFVLRTRFLDAPAKSANLSCFFFQL